MKKSLVNQIVKLWNENYAGSTAETATKAVVGTDGESVHIVPDRLNSGHAFFCAEEFVDVSRAFCVSSYVTQDAEGRLYGRIY